MKAEEFAEWLVDQVPRFDEMILADIRPKDGWVCSGLDYRGWLKANHKRVTAIVRGISENAANKVNRDPIPEKPFGYIQMGQMPKGTPAETNYPTLSHVWESSTLPWKK